MEMTFIRLALAVVACAMLVPHQQSRDGFGPGERVLLDAHNAYPEAGKWADRIDRALATGTPLAIEQDLFWRRVTPDSFVSVVAHDTSEVASGPTLEHYFFDRIAPVVDRALADNRRESWPLIVLNLDFKTNERAHHAAVFALLRKYERWVTSAPRTATPDVPATFTVGPLLVLSGADTQQRASFHDDVPVGQRLLVFGATPVPPATGATREIRAHALATMPADQLMPASVSNYARWVNFPWGVVEEGGQERAGEWTSAEATRLMTLVHRAHERGLWIRFYTLDGFMPEADRGFTASYNFGTTGAVEKRWNAAIRARVDFIATDQYAEFSDVLKRLVR